jgi:hypothetical protein
MAAGGYAPLVACGLKGVLTWLSFHCRTTFPTQPTQQHGLPEARPNWSAAGRPQRMQQATRSIRQVRLRCDFALCPGTLFILCSPVSLLFDGGCFR